VDDTGKERNLKLIVIVPAFNEQERIDATISALLAEKQTLAHKNINLLLYVIDDGSNDQTGTIAEKAGANRVLRHMVNRGLGAAVRTGLVAARTDKADIVVKFDADLQHDPKDILPLVEPIINDMADVVYGDRFEKISYKMPLIRKIGNQVFTGLMRWLTKWPLRDSQPGIFAINKSYLEVFQIPGDYNYTQQILLDAYHKGMRFEHCPVSFRKRVTGKSFISLRYPAKVLPQIIMVIVGVKPMKIFAPIGLSFFFIGVLVFGIELVVWACGGAAKPVTHVNAVLGSILFGIQTLFFGVLAQLIISMGRKE
jgi:glycosyltransferase involved in cell wall biosynthesis